MGRDNPKNMRFQKKDKLDPIGDPIEEVQNPVIADEQDDYPDTEAISAEPDAMQQAIAKVDANAAPTPGTKYVDTKNAPGVDEEYTLEVITDHYGAVDPFYLSEKDPRYEYRFLRAEDKNLSLKTSNLLHQKGGWQLVPREHLLRIGVKERFISADGLYRVGDQVLSFMPKALFDNKSAHKAKRAQAPMKAVDKMLKRGDPSVGAEIHDTMQGIQTQKNLGM